MRTASINPAPARVKTQHPADAAILWGAKLEGLSPVVQAVLLALCKTVVRRHTDGAAWIAYPSLTQLAAKAGVSRRATATAINTLIERGLLTREPGSVNGDTTVYTFGPEHSHRHKTPSAPDALGHEVHQSAPHPSAPGAHKSIDSPSPVLVSRIGKEREKKSLSPRTRESGKPKPESGCLWPAVQPRERRALFDLHAEMWTALVRQVCEGLELSPELAAKFAAPELQALMDAGLRHVGGRSRLHGFIKQPQDASFARNQFLAYCREHDPAYQALQEHDPSEKARAVEKGR